MTTASTLHRPFFLGLVALLGLSMLGFGAVTESPATGAETYTVAFEDAGAILDGSDLKISGVRAGSVTGLDVVDGLAHLQVSIDRAFLPLHEDATFEIRPVSLLGERYVDVAPGSPDRAAVSAGHLFPTSQSSRAVELDDVLNALDDPTSVSLSTLVTALGGGLAGQGEDAQALLDTLGPALADTDQLVAVLADQNDLLQQVVESLAPVTGALASDRGDRLDRLVASATDLFGATAARQQELEASIAQLPATLRTARTSLQQLAGLADRAGTTLADVRPVTGDLTDIASELELFAATADPALASLDPVLDHGERLVAELRPSAAALAPVTGELELVTGNLRPVVEEFVARRSAFFEFIRNWALTTNGSDGVSNYFRVSVTPAADALPLPVTDLPTLPGVELPDAVPGSGEALAPVDDVLDGVADAVGGIVGGGSLPGAGGLLDDGVDEESVTGLDEDQERGLLDFLLGGG